MTSPRSEPAPTESLARVRARYDELAADIDRVVGMPGADPAEGLRAGSLLAAEARLLDTGQFEHWLRWCGPDTMLWVPLAGGSAHPATDQSLFLDDYRRIRERVWRFGDPNAWAFVPKGNVTRSVSGVEAWRVPATQNVSADQDLLVSSVLSLQHVRSGAVWTTSGRVIHRFVPSPDPLSEWQLRHKIMILPALSAGTPHLGWLM